MVRLADIAERAGVSKTTVSHVLNGTRRVHPDTAARVRRAVEELGYRPNMLARSLRRKRTYTIGLLVSDIENPFFTELARAVETTAYERGYSLVLCNTDEDLQKEIMYAEALFAKRVDGLLVAPAPGDHSFLEPYFARGERVVLLNRTVPGLSAPAVICDDEQAIFTLATRLLADGHRRLGALLGLESVSTTHNRVTGLERALRNNGQTLDGAWLYPGGARQAGGRLAARAFVRLEDRPSAVIAFNTVMLEGFLLEIHRIAPDILLQTELAAHGHSVLAEACPSSRIYVEQPVRELGKVATDLLLDALDGHRPWTTEETVLKNRLVEFPFRSGHSRPVHAPASDEHDEAARAARAVPR